MAVVPTFETLLIEIRKSFGLPVTKERSKFTQVKAGENSHKELFTELKNDLVRQLRLSPSDEHAFNSQVQDWSVLSLKLNQSIWGGLLDQRQLLWLLATHIYVPCFAKLAAFWQSEGIMDKGMPADKFWYLPEQVNGELKLPITQVWEWLEDLVFDEHNSLEDQVYGEEDENAESIRLEVTRESFKRTLSNWKTATGIKSTKLIQSYFSDDLEIQYKGAYEFIESQSLDENFDRAIELLKNKGFTGESLYQEIQMESIEVVSKVLDGNCSDDLKKRFLELIIVRFRKPSNQTILNYMIFAHAFQNAYVRFGRMLHGNSFNPLSIDSSENKLNQLIVIYKFVYNLAYKISRDVNPGGNRVLFEKENIIFHKKVPEQFRYSIFQILCFNLHGKDGTHAAIEHVNDLILSLKCQEIPDVIRFNFISPSKCKDLNSDLAEHGGAINTGYAPGYTEVLFRLYEKLSIISEFDNKKSTNKKITMIKGVDNAEALIAFSCNQGNSLSVRRAAFHRLDELNLSDKNRVEQYTGQLAFLLNNETKFNRDKYAENVVSRILSDVKGNSYYEGVKSDFIQFEAKHQLSKGNVTEADRLLKEALSMPDKMSVGSNRGEIARDLFALRAANKMPGYNLVNQETLYRDMKYFGGFHLDDGISPLMALYWEEPASHLNPNKFFPPIDVTEKWVADYYPEIYQLYPVNK